MNDVLPPSATRRLRGLVAARSLADHDGVGLETVNTDEALARGPGATSITERLESALSPETRAGDEIADEAEYARALHTLLDTTRRAGERLDADPDAPLTVAETMALEAVIRADGSRPSLPIRQDRVQADNPMAGSWTQTLRDTADALASPIASVGRVEPVNPHGRNFFGTCWVVDGGAGLVLTNAHVVEAMWRRLPFTMSRMERGFRVLDGAFVDFVAESGSTRTNRCRVVEAILPGIEGPRYSRLDVAVLKIEPLEGGTVPAAIPVHADPDGPAGNLFSFCIVGFPGAPEHIGGVHDGVDWTWVNTTLFGNRYGVKRLAPGTVHRPLGTLTEDPRRWVLGHDPTTLGGNSGSPLLDWSLAAPGAFGIHFAGATLDTNVAHAVVACAAELRGLGVPVREP